MLPSRLLLTVLSAGALALGQNPPNPTTPPDKAVQNPNRTTTPDRAPTDSQTTKRSTDRAEDQATSKKVSSSDRSFMQKAYMDGEHEIDIAKLALQQGSSSEVKTFAQRQVDDHTKANQDLQMLAQQKGV